MMKVMMSVWTKLESFMILTLIAFVILQTKCMIRVVVMLK